MKKTEALELLHRITVECELSDTALNLIGKTITQLEDETLCPYHQDSLTWDACTEGFDGCRMEK